MSDNLSTTSSAIQNIEVAVDQLAGKSKQTTPILPHFAMCDEHLFHAAGICGKP